MIVSIFSSNGAVRGLEAGDFTLRDSGHDVNGVNVLELSDLPLDLLVVHQNRASLTPDQDRVFAASFSALMSAMRGGDRVGVVTTGLPPQVGLPLGPTARQVNLPEEGVVESALWDAVALALSQFDSSERRQVIVLLSTGTDRRSLLPPNIVLRAARRARMQIVHLGCYVVPTATIRLSKDSTTGRINEEATISRANRFPPAELRKLAEDTGGQVVNLGGADPQARVRTVVERLRFGYLLSFTPRPEPGWHPVQVNVRRRGVSVAARAGYFR